MPPTYTWDVQGRVTQVLDALGNTQATTYTSNSDMAQQTDAAGKVTTYTYDVLNRLLEAQTKNSGGSVISDYQYAYDGASNRTSQSGTGGTGSYTCHAANELTAAGGTTFTYDANGNETSSSAGLALAYNAKDQTSSLTPPGGSALAQSYTGATQIQRVTEASTSFKHSTLGLTSQTDGSGTTYFTRDNTGPLVGSACRVEVGSTTCMTGSGTWWR